MSGAPHPKSAQLARGERRYRRKVASPKQWQAIIAAKRGDCRLCATLGVGVGRAWYGPIEYHHLVLRAQGGDDVEDNIVPMHRFCHSQAHSQALAREAVARSLTDAEYAYVIGKLGEGGMERLFGVSGG